MSGIKVSVIIPFYKVEKYFERCLFSVVNQTLKEIEILLFDDCGGGKSVEIAEKFAKEDNRIKIFYNNQNRGQGYSRNRGIEEAKGEYIAFLDSDDWIEPEMYEKLYEKAKASDSDITKCSFNYINKDKNEEYILNVPDDNFEKTYCVYDNPIIILGFVSNSIWNGLHKREFLLENQIKFIHTKFEDMVFTWETFCKAKKISYIKDVFYNYNKLNCSQDTGNRKFIVKYSLINCQIIKEKFLSDKRLNDAFLVYCYFILNWVYKSIKGSMSFNSKKAFESFYKLTKDIRVLDYQFFTDSVFISPKIKSLLMNRYDEYTNKGSVITQITRLINYALK